MSPTEVPPSVVIGVLGPLRLVVGDVAVDVRGPKRRAVLAMLALAEGRTVPADHLVDALWPAEPPESGRQSLHTHMSRLRSHFGAAASRIETQYDGYRLELGADGLDVVQARSLLAAGTAAAQHDPARAYSILQRAHGLWRGPMLTDLVDVEQIATAVEGYERLHRTVIDVLIATAIEAGEATAVIEVASDAMAADPLREQSVLLLMRTLAATAQAPAALQVGRDYRHQLVEETGLDPSSALQELERDIASGAVGPVAPARSESPPEPTPVRTPSATPAPSRPSTRLIGRESQVAGLHRLLAEHRLVTLVGPGGVGKSRVALEVAGPVGAATVLLLAPVTDPAAVPHALAAALNLTVARGDVFAACVAVLAERPGLLVVDNCEHLLDAARDTVEMVLAACPGVTILATSRERLGLAAEFSFRLAPLPLPGPSPGGSTVDAAALEQVPSVAVFLDRAARVRPGYLSGPADLRQVADIVRRLDGMPLAIELAAGRLSSFSLPDLYRRLDRSLDLLGSGRPSGNARHQTLRATIEWSYDLLPDDEQRLFRNMAVHVDGIDLESAEGLAGHLGLAGDPGSLLAHLVDASMVDAEFGDRTRYSMLETLRAFGIDRLAATGEQDAATRHLIRWTVTLTGWIRETMTTENEPLADAVLRRELANLRAAWQLTRRDGSIDDAAAIVTALFDSVAYRDLIEIRSWAEDLVGDPNLQGHPLAAAVLGTAAESAYHRGDYPRAEQLATTGLAVATDDTGRWMCESTLAVLHLARGHWAEVIEHSLIADGLAALPRENLGVAALAMAYAGDLDGARRINDRGVAAAVSPTMRSWGAYVTGEIDAAAGHPDRAEAHYLHAIALAHESGATFLVGVATVGVLSVQVASGRIDEALAGYDDVIGYFARTGNWTHLWTTLRNLANLLRRLGDDEPADLLDAAADQAPDAPADNRSHAALRTPTDAAAPVPGRAVALDIARSAIRRHHRRS